MTAGYLLGIGLALLLYLLVRMMERDDYRRRHEAIKRKQEKLEEAGRAGAHGPRPDRRDAESG